MNDQEIKDAIQKLHWERWLKRPVHAFMLSLFNESITRECMLKTGVNTEYFATVFQEGVWYKSPEVHISFKKEIQTYIDSGGSIFQVSKSCEDFLEDSRKRILAMRSEPDSQLIKNLSEFKDIVNQVNAYVWLTYGFEEIYTSLLEQKVSHYITDTAENFIRAISIPSKKNAYAKMEQALRSSRALESIQDEFGWINSRDGFTEGFSLSELEELRKRIRSSVQPSTSEMEIPAALAQLVREVQELIYFRTLRGDARSELIFLMRPILRKVAGKYRIPFEEFPYYSVYDLIRGSPIRYPPTGTFLFFKGNMLFTEKPVIEEKELTESIIKGQSAFSGTVVGIVKIVTKTADLDKVNEGDILVAPMTFPAFIIGMRRAAAFVTDEGGITSHAAIIAREMRKPCIVGTKIATRALKDGDTVKVDAENGIVQILKI
ncbi:MAG: PEP-utilizing enzyme [Patescibacteria group bacterium]